MKKLGLFLTLIIITVIILIATPAFAERLKYTGLARSEGGAVLASATVAVYLAGTTTPADVYEASSGGTSVNEVTTDSNGRWTFYADTTDYAFTQEYKVVVTKDGYSSITLDNIFILRLPTNAVGVLYNDGSGNYSWGSSLSSGGITLADDSTLTLPPAASTYDSGLLGCSTDGTCSWIDPTSLLTSVDLSSVTITGGTENSIAIWDGSQNLTGTTTPALGTPASGTLTNCSGLPASGLVPSTSQAVGFGTIELGHASDTTISRTAAGIAAIEGNVIGGALTPVIGDADDFDDNFTGVNLYGGTYIVSGAGTIILPEATAGMNFTIVLEGAVATIIDPLGTGTADTIYMNGLAAAADENITSSTLGAMCVFQYRAANTWMATCNGFAEATPP